MFFWNSLAFLMIPVDVGNLISGSSAFSKTNLNIRKFTVHVLLKPGLENFEHYIRKEYILVYSSCLIFFQCTYTGVILYMACHNFIFSLHTKSWTSHVTEYYLLLKGFFFFYQFCMLHCFTNKAKFALTKPTLLDIGIVSNNL